MINITKHEATGGFILWRWWYNLVERRLWQVYWFWKSHRFAYCQGYTCYHATNGTGVWTLCREQVFARSTASAWMCEECADEEQQEVDAAWAEYYGGLL